MLGLRRQIGSSLPCSASSGVRRHIRGDEVAAYRLSVDSIDAESFVMATRMKTRLRNVAPIGASIAMIIALGIFIVTPMVRALGPSLIDLKTASSFAVLAGTTVTNAGVTSTTTLIGDLGVSPGTAVTGFPPGTVSGTTHLNDAAAAQAKTDLAAAYGAALALPADQTLDLTNALDGEILAGGIYTSGAPILNLAGTLTLDGQDDATSVWVFQATSSLITAAASEVVLINGASACNVFWQVTSSATLGANSIMVGTIMASASVTMDDNVTLTGRALASTASVTLINDHITTCAPVVDPTPTPVPSVAESVAPSVAESVAPSVAESVAPSVAESVAESGAPVPTPVPTPTPTSVPTDTPTPESSVDPAVASPTPTATASASQTPMTLASAAPTATASIVPNTAQHAATTTVSWQLFLLTLAFPPLLTLVAIAAHDKSS